MTGSEFRPRALGASIGKLTATLPPLVHSHRAQEQEENDSEIIMLQKQLQKTVNLSCIRSCLEQVTGHEELT